MIGTQPLVLGLLFGSTSVVLLCGLLLVRNWQVRDERLRVLDIVGSRGKREIYRGNDYRIWFDKFELVTYNRMLLYFWRPIRSFYSELVTQAESDMRRQQ